MAPAVGWCRPMIERSSVDLPAPLAPQLGGLALEQAEPSRWTVRVPREPGLLEDPGGNGVALDSREPSTAIGGHQQVLEDRHVLEWTRHLVGARDSHATPRCRIEP